MRESERESEREVILRFTERKKQKWAGDGERERRRGGGCVLWQRGFTPHRLAIPREGHVNGINHEHIIVFRADAKAHAAHAPGRRRDIALWAIAAGA